jgi:hypothetical protein
MKLRFRGKIGRGVQDRTGTLTVGQKGNPTLRGTEEDRRCSRNAACYLLFVLYQFLSI